MLICTPIQEKSQSITLKRLKELKGKVDLAEIWLDHIQDLDVKALLKKSPLPIICVYRKPAEKGRFKGDYSQIADLLFDAARYEAEYIDIPLLGFRSADSEELRTPSEIQKTGFSRLIRKKSQIDRRHRALADGVSNHKSQIIISHHDFKKTPSLNWMLKTAHEMKKKGADIVKIAVMARSLEDTFTVISLAQLLQAEKIPHILIAMGKKGVLSRVLTPFLGGTIMFAPLTAKKATASGQLTVSELKKAWSLIKK